MRARAELALPALHLIATAEASDLEALAEARGVVADPSWSAYQVAVSLTQPHAVWRQLAGCNRECLIFIDHLLSPNASPHEPLPAALPLGLVQTPAEGSPQLSPEVTHAIDSNEDSWRATLDRLTTTPPPPHPVDSATNWAPPSLVIPAVLDTLSAISHVVGQVSSEPVSTRLATPAVLAKALQARGEAMTGLETASVWAMDTGLCVFHDGVWWVTDDGLGFLDADEATRLVTLLERWWHQAPSQLRQVLTESPGALSVSDTVDAVSWRFPLADVGPVRHWLAKGVDVGGYVGQSPTTLLAQLIGGRLSADAVAAELPPRQDTVYPDGLDAFVAAGPVSTDVHRVLAEIGRETRGGMSPRFLIDRSRILHTLATTDSGSLVDRLGGVIVGGVPDHLALTITDLETRATALWLTTARDVTVISCDSPALADLLEVDHKLAGLGMTRVLPDRLETHVPIPFVRSVLADAGYPTFPDATQAVTPVVWEGEASSGVDRSWWESKRAEASQVATSPHLQEDILRDAIAGKIPLSICVEVGGEKRWLVGEPKSVSGGRLRIMDSASDVERTLPLSHIVSLTITPA